VHAPTDRAEHLYTEKCQACNGTGNWNSRAGYQCFKCNGKGVLTYKTSPESRKSSKDSADRARVRKAQEIANSIAAFEKANPEIIEWMNANPDFEFAASCKEQFYRKGELSEKQVAAILRQIERKKEQDKARDAAKAAAMASAPVVTTAKLEACFAKVLAAGNKRVTLTFSNVTFSPAPTYGVNAGAVYVKERSTGNYLGKVIGNRFLVSRNDVKPEQVEFIADVLNDPRAAAIKHGKLTGACCVCSRLLTNDESIELGIGPICAEKMGW
jgi:hypothetical protein